MWNAPKKVLKKLIPQRLCEARNNFLIAKKLTESKYEFEDKSGNKVSQIIDTVKLFSSPKKIIAFYPYVPPPGFEISNLCAFLNYKMVKAPHKNADCEAVYNNSTYTDAEKIEEGISNLDNALNGRCLDISKEHVENCFEKAFSYPLKIDPTQHHGQVLKKSTFNYTHDGVIIDTPIEKSEIEKHFVYQRAINNETEDGHFLDYRVPVHGNEIPIVFERYRSPTHRFTKVSYVKMITPESAFSSRELELIVNFTKLMHMDFGGLDILRDNDNGKIYIVDANHTPHYFTLPDNVKEVAYKKLSKTFERLIKS